MSGVVCIGAAAVDLGLRLDSAPVLGTSNIATAAQSLGGVARNVAELLARFGAPTSLVTAVGDDPAGHALLARMAEQGVDVTNAAVVAGVSTAQYVAVLDPAGELVLGVNDMRVTSALTAAAITAVPIAEADWVFAECNLDAEALEALLDAVHAHRRGAASPRLAVDTISVPKCARLPATLDAIDLLFTNVDEANALLGRAEPRTVAGGLALSAAALDRGVGAAVVTLGDGGHVVRTADAAWWSAAVRAEVVDVTGAGDALIAATISGLLRGLALPDAAREGALAAAITAESPGVAPTGLTRRRLADDHHRLDAVATEGPLP